MSFSALNAAMARPFISATYTVMDFYLYGVLNRPDPLLGQQQRKLTYRHQMIRSGGKSGTTRLGQPKHDDILPHSITGIGLLDFSGGDICSISDASSSLARELLTRFDTGQHCSTSFAAGFSNSSPALPLSHGSN